MNVTIWILTEGHSIEGVFDTKETAFAFHSILVWMRDDERYKQGIPTYYARRGAISYELVQYRVKTKEEL